MALDQLKEAFQILVHLTQKELHRRCTSQYHVREYEALDSFLCMNATRRSKMRHSNISELSV